MEVNMKTEKHIWSIFVPYQFLALPNGYLFGKVVKNKQRIYITRLESYDSGNTLPVTDEHIIGEWSGGNQGRQLGKHNSRFRTKQNMWLTLFKGNSGQIDCILNVDGEKPCINCILFNPNNILESYFLRQPAALEKNKNDMIEPLISFSGIVCDQLQKEGTYFEMLKAKFDKFNLSYRFLQFWTLVYSFLTILIDNRYTQHTVLKYITEIPSYCQHLNMKKKVLVSTKNSQNRVFGIQNILCQVLFDVFLGVLVMAMLMQEGVIENASKQFFVWTEKVANELDILLNWLMGAPAGLKLNKPLTEFLGHFFMYHIYLWKGYLLILKPVFSSVLWLTSCVGILGISAQICLLQDIISITTLHIYCFYVYAARLYRLQVYVLSAFWRLFRGKKWNVLRHRVDSASFDVDQLFVGTLLFTIFLFLLPTTALYYTVFTLLRMVVLLFQGFLSTVVYMVNHIPLYSILLWVIGSSKVSGDLSLDVVPSDHQTDCQVFSLQVKKIPFGELIKMSTLSHSGTSQPLLSWKHFLLSLIKGHLVYPWMDFHKESVVEVKER